MKLRCHGSLAATLLALAVAGCTPAGPSISAEEVWSRPTAVAGPGVVYMTLVNHGGAPDRLVGAGSTICGVVEIHETLTEGDRMRMRPRPDGIEIPDAGRVELRPGGLHLMLFDLERELRAGDRFEIELRFEQAGPVTVVSEVRQP